MQFEPLRTSNMSFKKKLMRVNWAFIFLLVLIASIGVVMLFSAASGSWHPWASRHVMRFGIGLVILLAVALTDIRLWLRYAYALYILTLILLVAVEFSGIGMGAQRWISLGFISLQPSEIIKITLILALARYFHSVSIEENSYLLTKHLMWPLVMVLLPVVLMLRQPDLGTAILLMIASAVLFFMAGIRMRVFAIIAALGLSILPITWNLLHEYQKKRVLTFLNPESDPLGAGYHIIQSKIALGAGGMVGKGFMQGSQSRLNFLPEKQTDFIFTMLAEEFGMIGGIVLIALYALILLFGIAISLRNRNQFSRLLGIGITSTFFLYVFINIAMVTGLVPVVGVPLPLISYGGSAMLTLMFSFGLMMSIYIHHDVIIGPRGVINY